MASYPKPARRRANREGTIYHVASENRWRAALTWTDANGKRHRRIVSGKTQSDVRRRLGSVWPTPGVSSERLYVAGPRGSTCDSRQPSKVGPLRR